MCYSIAKTSSHANENDHAYACAYAQIWAERGRVGALLPTLVSDAFHARCLRSKFTSQVIVVLQMSILNDSRPALQMYIGLSTVSGESEGENQIRVNLGKEIASYADRFSSRRHSPSTCQPPHFHFIIRPRIVYST